jgi:hypothetical protein
MARSHELNRTLVTRDLLEFLPTFPVFDIFENGKHSLSIVDLEREQWPEDDLPCLDAATIIRVEIEGNYYGPEYARGYWPEIAAVIEFLRHRIPSSRVWYGPDNTDDFTEMTHDAMVVMWGYWSQYGSRSYRKRSRSQLNEGIPLCQNCRTQAEFLAFNEVGSKCIFCPACGQIYACARGESDWRIVKPETYD